MCGGSLLRIPPSFGSMCAYLNRVAGSWLSVTAMIRVTGLKFLRGASPFTPTGGWGPQPQTPFFTKSHVFPTSYWVFDTAAYVKWYPHTCTASEAASGRGALPASCRPPRRVCNRAPSSCLCHVAVRDRFAGLSSSVLCWSGFERSDTVRKLLGMIICVLVTPSNTSLVPTAITGPRAPTQGARSAAHFWGLV